MCKCVLRVCVCVCISLVASNAAIPSKWCHICVFSPSTSASSFLSFFFCFSHTHSHIIHYNRRWGCASFFLGNGSVVIRLLFLDCNKLLSMLVHGRFVILTVSTSSLHMRRLNDRGLFFVFSLFSLQNSCRSQWAERLCGEKMNSRRRKLHNNRLSLMLKCRTSLSWVMRVLVLEALHVDYYYYSLY